MRPGHARRRRDLSQFDVFLAARAHGRSAPSRFRRVASSDRRARRRSRRRRTAGSHAQRLFKQIDEPGRADAAAGGGLIGRSRATDLRLWRMPRCRRHGLSATSPGIA